MPVILTLDAALGGCSAGLVQDGSVLAERYDGLSRAAALPSLAEAVLRGCACPDLIAVTVGPGRFTGLRAALALAHGIALAADRPVVGVTLGAAWRHLAPAGRVLWTAIDSGRDRVFLERGGIVETVGLDEIPAPSDPVALAGDAAAAVAARWAGCEADALLLDAARPSPLGIALAALRGDTHPPLPLYVDPPEARPGPPGRPAPR